MAWTAPMTFVAGAALTAAQLNTHLRDNMMETEIAKASLTTSWIVGAGPNAVVERAIATSRVTTTQTTTRTDDWADLATPGPAVTVTTGTSALVFMYVNMENSAANAMTRCSWAVTGATERTPWEMTELRVDGIPGVNPVSYSNVDFMTTLTPGVNTFTMKYRVGSGTGSFRYRCLIVMPF